MLMFAFFISLLFFSCALVSLDTLLCLLCCCYTHTLFTFSKIVSINWVLFIWSCNFLFSVFFSLRLSMIFWRLLIFWLVLVSPILGLVCVVVGCVSGICSVRSHLLLLFCVWGASQFRFSLTTLGFSMSTFSNN